MEIEKGTKKFIDRTLKNQRAASEKARLEYEKSGDPEIVIKFIKRSPSAAPLNESWIIEAIQKWIRNDRYDLVKLLCPRRGERSNARTRAIKDMIFVERIDKCRKAGKFLKEIFYNEAQRAKGRDVSAAEIAKEESALRNKYYRAKRIKTEVTIQEKADSFIISAFPAKITKGDFAAFGTWTITLPKK